MPNEYTGCACGHRKHQHWPSDGECDFCECGGFRARPEPLPFELPKRVRCAKCNAWGWSDTPCRTCIEQAATKVKVITCPRCLKMHAEGAVHDCRCPDCGWKHGAEVKCTTLHCVACGEPLSPGDSHSCPGTEDATARMVKVTSADIKWSPSVDSDDDEEAYTHVPPAQCWRCPPLQSLQRPTGRS